jgi:hypothetical protein
MYSLDMMVDICSANRASSPASSDELPDIDCSESDCAILRLFLEHLMSKSQNTFLVLLCVTIFASECASCVSYASLNHGRYFRD